MLLRGPLVGPDRWWSHTLLKGTVRDTLASYGSHCSAAYGFARSTGFLPSLVDPGFGL